MPKRPTRALGCLFSIVILLPLLMNQLMIPFSHPPKVRHLKEESSFRFEESIAVNVSTGVPLNLLIERSISDMYHRAWDIRERGQKIGKQLLLVFVVLENSPEEKVLVQLIRQ